MPSRRRRGNLIKKKLHPEVVKVLDEMLSRRPSYGRDKHSSIKDFLFNIYGCWKNEEQRNILRAYYSVCVEEGFNPPPDGYFDTSNPYDYKYIRHY